MTDVYLNATVTIAADGALNEEGGCFAPFDSACQTRNTSISIPCLNSDGIECRVHCRLPMQPNNFRNNFPETAHIIPHNTSRKANRSELSSRGWTLQERLLSPRILHFSSTEMAWECATQLCCECIPMPRIDLYRSYKSGFFGQETSILQLKQTTNGSSYPRATQWGKMVEEFTSRKLSYASDRLPAISGLAGLIQADSDDEYVCGLWRRTLARELLWAVETESTLFSHGEYQLSRRHEYYYAPSWSWAAVTGHIHPSRYFDDSWEEVMEIYDVSLILASSNPFGPASSGSLTVCGHLTPVWVIPLACEKEIVPCSNLSLRFCASSIKLKEPSINIGMLEPDVLAFCPDLEINMDEPLFLLTVLKSASSIKTRSIVLKAVKGVTEKYQRVGYFDDSLTDHSLFPNLCLCLWNQIAGRRTLVII